MRPILLVFIADIFQNVRVRLEQVGNLYRERFVVHLGVVECDVDVEVADIAAPVERSVMRMASLRGCPTPSSQTLSFTPIVSTMRPRFVRWS